MQVILLVAGQGSRMGQLTESTHKSLLSPGNGDSFYPDSASIDDMTHEVGSRDRTYVRSDT